MADRTPTHTLLTSVALATHDATEDLGDIRAVRAWARRELSDLDGALVEDLLISAGAKLVGIDPDVDALVRSWGAPVLRRAAARLVSVLNTIPDRA